MKAIIFRIALFFILSSFVLITLGCGGYTMQSQYLPGVSTVAVPIWDRGKDVYRRDLEFRLTEAIQKRIEMDTPYKVTDKSRADTQLTGTIDKVSQRVLSSNPDSGEARELEETFYLTFEWKDLRSGKILVTKKNFRVSSTYISDEPLREEFFQGSEEVINRLAKRVVEQMEADW